MKFGHFIFESFKEMSYGANEFPFAPENLSPHVANNVIKLNVADGETPFCAKSNLLITFILFYKCI